MAFPGDINALVSVNSSDSLATAGHAARHNEVKTALEGVRDALGGTAVTSGAVAPVLAAGAAGTPSLSFTGDANTGLWSPAADTVAVSTGGTERMRIDNAGLITGTGTSLGAWTSYTPTLGGTGWALGNGTITAGYCQIGKTVHMKIYLTWGSTSTFGASSTLTITLPVNRISGYWPVVSAGAYDASLGQHYQLFSVANSTSLLTLYTAAQPSGAVTATTPFTWASTDTIEISATYEIA